MLEADGQKLAGFFRRGDHLFTFVRRHRHRLFDHHVTARFGGRDRGRAVNAVRGADVDRFRLDRLEEVVPLLEALFGLDSVFFLVLGQPFRIDVAEADQLDLRNRFVGRHMGVADTAAADDRHTKLLRSFHLLYRCLLRRSLFGRSFRRGFCRRLLCRCRFGRHFQNSFPNRSGIYPFFIISQHFTDCKRLHSPGIDFLWGKSIPVGFPERHSGSAVRFLTSIALRSGGISAVFPFFFRLPIDKCTGTCHN